MITSNRVPPAANRVLQLARHDRAAAQAVLAELPLDGQVALVCASPVARRGELLGLLPDPAAVIPEIPEAELCFTIKAVGLDRASWILEHVTPEQTQACVDLDAWDEDVPDDEALDLWMQAFAETEDESLLRAARALDPELMMLWLHARLGAVLEPDDDPGWESPDGSRTIDGQFYLLAHREGDDIAAPLRLLGVLFQGDYWFYFRLLQALSWELVSDNQEHALRWRTGRLQDLGFPDREEALRIYAPPTRRELDTLPDIAPTIGSWHLPIWLPELPASPEAGHALFRAAVELDPEERRSLLYTFLAVVNKVAVADRLPLGEAESMPVAFEKAAAFTSAGLLHLAERHGISPAELLRRHSVHLLFRVGSSLDPTGGSP
ncbi:MAG TPA: DUF6178 family protein [Polyangia bacterium]|nr:DUF6178 family protein [Polyangia bacterium]